LKWLHLFLIFFLLIIVNYVVAQPVDNPNFVSQVAWVNYTERVGSVDEVLESKISVFGTEYVAGDNAKVFLQFLDDYKQPVNDSTCFLDVFYPNASIWFDDLIMSYADDGLYYRNIFLDEEIVADGVYMVSAKCYQPLSVTYFDELIATEDFESGDIYGGSGWASPFWEMELAEIVSADGQGNGCYNSSFCLRATGSYGYADRGFRADLNAKSLTIDFKIHVDGFQNDEVANFWIFDGEWVNVKEWNLLNTPMDTWLNYSVVLSSDDYHFGNMIWDIDMTGSPSANDEVYIDDIVITQQLPNVTIGNETGYQILRGAGEIHISKLGGNIISSVNSSNADVLSAVAGIPFIDYNNNFSDVLSQISSIPFIDYNKNFTDVLSQISVVSSLVSNVDADLIVHNANIESLISGLEGDVASLSSSSNANFNLLDGRIDVLESKIDLILSKLNIVTSELNLEAVTNDCLEGSVWSIEVTATDNFANYLNSNDISCNVTTNLWGVNELVWNIDSFDYENECGYNNDTITWVVDCENI